MVVFNLFLIIIFTPLLLGRKDKAMQERDQIQKYELCCRLK